MLFMTYQPDSESSMKVLPKYDELKSLLGIPADKQIYWCFPANNVFQALLNSFSSEPYCPKKLCLFNTEEYYMIDKIKWKRLIEEDETDHVTKDVLNIEFSDMSEYIVTSIPKNAKSLYLTDIVDKETFDEFIKKEQSLPVGRLAHYDSLLKRVLTPAASFRAIADHYLLTIGKSADFKAFVQEDSQNDIAVFFKRAFETTAFTYIYDIMRFSMSLNFAHVFNHHVLSYDTLLEYYDRYETEYSTAITYLSNEDAYNNLSAIYKDLYFDVFCVTPFSNDEVEPNEPCPCGSGKKYKQCHGKLGATGL